MAWFYGTYSCGHEGRTNVIGPTKDRQRIADFRFAGFCEECWQRNREEEREKARQEAIEQAEIMQLPDLQGSDKQIAWAVTIRQSMLSRLERYIVDDGLKKDAAESIRDYWLSKTSASWWIDNRGRAELQDIVAFAKKAKEEKRVETSVKMELEIKAEATIAPENAIKIGVVEISVLDDTILVGYAKDEDFRAIVRRLGYRWDDNIYKWGRQIDNFAGTPQDRAAELGNKLLNEGFSIMILDEKVRKMAIEGTFEPEQKRWVAVRLKGEFKGWFSIEWENRNDEMYVMARKLPGSRWDRGCVLVKSGFYKEVEEFAELMGFKLSSGAIKKIAEEKELERQRNAVVPTRVEAKEVKDDLAEILVSNSDILTDLKDE